MSEMIDRVARAICARRKMAACRCARHKGECLAPVLVLRDAGHEDQARAAIEAMREPTEAMSDAGWIDKEDVSPAEIWLAMIDVALAQNESAPPTEASGAPLFGPGKGA